MEEGTPRHCVPCSDGQSLKLRPTRATLSSTVPRGVSTGVGRTARGARVHVLFVPLAYGKDMHATVIVSYVR